MPRAATAGYTEKIIYLPGTWLLNENPLFDTGARGVAAVAGAGGGAKVSYPWHVGPERSRRNATFCNFGRVWKFDADTLHQWCQIVREVPGSRYREMRRIVRSLHTITTHTHTHTHTHLIDRQTDIETDREREERERRGERREKREERRES